MANKNYSFEKYPGNPVFGNIETGTMFDAYVRKQADGDFLYALGINVLSGSRFGNPITIEALRGDDESLDKEVEADE